jgi:2-amino-4-hydroxy-6-hydroxymethyldihydropteridine diphosphokinase
MIAYIGIGANLGDASATVDEALARLDRIVDTRLVARSAKYRTAPIDSSGDDYVNAVACVATELEGLCLLRALQQIELDHGRERPYRNAPRTLDLDLLLYDGRTFDTADLQVPHPRMTARAFVLVPLLEIAPHVQVPGVGAAAQFLAAVQDQGIERM